MPALVWMGRRWRSATDDFVFSSLFYCLGLVASAVMALSRIDVEAATYIPHCPAIDVGLGRCLLGMSCVNIIATASFIGTALVSLRGGVFEVSKRRSVPFLLYLNAACMLASFGLSLAAAVYTFYEGQVSSCTVVSTRHLLRGSILLSLIYFGIYVVLSAIAFDPSGRKEYRDVHDYARTWWRRCGLCCCTWAKKERDDDAYNDVAQVFANAFRAYDMVPSDIAAGMLLLHGYQSQSRRVLRTRVRYAPHPDGLQETVAAQAQPTRRLSAAEVMEVRDLCTYSRFFIACYGWLLHEYQHCGTGLARLCCFDPYLCCRRHPGKHYGSRICFDMAALLKETGIPSKDILLTSWKNTLFSPVHCAVYDASTDALVIAIRGTMSLKDCVTDLAALPAPMELRDTPAGVPKTDYYAHGGMLRSAQQVWKSLEYNGVFQLMQHGNLRGKKVVVLGHSLGAGVAIILSIMMYSEFPDVRQRLRCLAYSPPGGTVSAACVDYAKDFTLGTYLGYDMIPRLALHTLDGMREALFDVLAASKTNKSILFLNFFRTDDVAKSFHPSTAETVTSPSVPEESRLFREALRHPLCMPTAPTKELFNCARLVHFRKVVQRHTSPSCPTCCYGCNKSVYIPAMTTPQDIQVLLSSPTMFTDHFPDKLYRVMERTLREFDLGELDRYYTDDSNDLAPVREAPMHYVDYGASSACEPPVTTHSPLLS